MELTLNRAWPKSTYTIGKLFIDGVRYHETLEPPDRGLTADMPVSKIRRIKGSYPAGKTAIPTGTYRVKLTYSTKFARRPWAKRYGGLVPEILNVKGFSGVRIHPGTDQYSTDGCPLIGENKIKGKVINSVEKYCALMEDYLIPADVAGKEIWITVK